MEGVEEEQGGQCVGATHHMTTTHLCHLTPTWRLWQWYVYPRVLTGACCLMASRPGRCHVSQVTKTATCIICGCRCP
jgi:hypothetical protein